MLFFFLTSVTVIASAQVASQQKEETLIGDSLYFYYFKQKDILYSTFTESGESLTALNYLIGNHIMDLREGEIYFKITAYIDAAFPDKSKAINYASIQAAAIKSYIVQRYHMTDDHFVFVAQDKVKYQSCMGYTVVEMIQSSQVPTQWNQDFFYTLNNTRSSSRKAVGRYNYYTFLVPSAIPEVPDTLTSSRGHRKPARWDAEELTKSYASIAEESRRMAEKEAVLSDSLLQKTIREFIMMEYNVGISGTEIFGDKRAFRNLNADTVRAKSTFLIPMGLKTNLLGLATGTLNLEANLQIAPKMTVHLPVSFNPWTYTISDKERYFKHLAIEPGLRYWFNSAYFGQFVSLYAIGITYNACFDGAKSYEVPLSHNQSYYNPKNYRYGKEDFNYGVGFGYGCAWLLSPNFNIETEIGLGIGRASYDIHYEGYIEKSVRQWQVFPARLSVGFSFLF